MGQSDSTAGRWVVAIDGGGSKVAGAIAPLSLNGDPQSSFTAANSIRLKSAGVGSAAAATWKDARINLSSMFDNLLEQAGARPSQIAHVALMLAGAGRPDDVQRTTDSLLNGAAFAECGRLTVTSDIGPLIQHASKLDTSSPAIVVIAGTGSLVGAVDQDRQLIRAGGWGPILGDEASGWRIAVGALKPICVWMDRGSPMNDPPEGLETVTRFLTDRQLLSDPGRLASALLSLVSDRHLAAQLAPDILQLSALPDGTATLRNLQAQFWLLVKQIEDVYRRLEVKTNWRLCLAGGLASNNQRYQSLLAAELQSRPFAPWSMCVLDPLEAGLSFAAEIGLADTNQFQ